MIAMALTDGPRTLSEIEDNFYAFARRSGLFLEAGRHTGVLASELVHEIDDMIAEGQIALQDGCYRLTDRGRREADQHLLQMRRVGRWVRQALEPESATRVAVGVHLVLAALKLPAGLLSGSVGLLNDAADTLLDGLASVLAFLGVRYGKERAVNVVLVVLMLGTGLLTLSEAIRRFLEPQGPGADMLAFAASVVSGVVCGVLGIYQRYVGLKCGSLALITQSVDSRNHVVVATGVLLGLVASRLGFSAGDALVGVGVALLILKSGVEVAAEMWRSLKDEQIDMSRYEPSLVDRFTQFRQGQLRDWMLYLIGKGLAQTRDDLLAQARQAHDFERYPALRELGLGGQAEHEQVILQALAELDGRGWIVGETRLAITDAGREHLQSVMQRPRRAMRRTGHTPPI
jgi:cation diffusion facilitator family transporter